MPERQYQTGDQGLLRGCIWRGPFQACGSEGNRSRQAGDGGPQPRPGPRVLRPVRRPALAAAAHADSLRGVVPQWPESDHASLQRRDHFGGILDLVQHERRRMIVGFLPRILQVDGRVKYHVVEVRKQVAHQRRHSDLPCPADHHDGERPDHVMRLIAQRPVSIHACRAVMSSSICRDSVASLHAPADGLAPAARRVRT
jgi:hypothetical protein